MDKIKENWKKLVDFLKEARAELKKVTFMDRKTTARAALAVVVVSLFFALYLGLVDLGFSKIVAHFLSS